MKRDPRYLAYIQAVCIAVQRHPKRPEVKLTWEHDAPNLLRMDLKISNRSRSFYLKDTHSPAETARVIVEGVDGVVDPNPS